jgi:hypothetical protein
MANSDELAEVEVNGQGHDLHWEKLDVDLSVSGLLAGLFGTKAFMGRQYTDLVSFAGGQWS